MTLSKIVLASILCAAAAMAHADTSGVHPVTGETLAPEQTFTYRVERESHSIDPGSAQDSDGGGIIRDLFEGLYNQKADGTLRPGVALSHDVSEDRLTYTFTMRDDAKWSNGDKVTAGDFEYAWKRSASPELNSPYSWFVSLMALENAEAVIDGSAPLDTLGVRALDDTTLKVSLSKPIPYFTQMTTHFTTFPVHRPTVEKYGADWIKPENMVSNGAYVLTEHVPNEILVRSRNAAYWDNANTIMDEITSLVIPDENTALSRFFAGELDLTSVPSGQYAALVGDYPKQTVSVPMTCTYFYTINLTETGNPALRDPDVRRALSLAIDRNLIAESVITGGHVPAYSFTHWAMPDWTAPELEIVSMSQHARNREAVELIAGAGYGPGGDVLSINLIHDTSGPQKAVAVAISEMWKQILGVETTRSDQDWGTYVETLANRNYEVGRSVWCADYNEPSSFVDLFQSGSNYNDAGYVNATVDALLEEAKTAQNPMPLYRHVEEIAADDVPIIPIYHYALVKMMAPELKGWPLENFQQIWYGRELYKVAE